MTDPPDRITVGIEEEDIRDDISKILDSMNVIRLVGVSDGEITDEAKDQYLHLSYRLASMLKSVSEEHIKEKLAVIEEALNQNNALLNYDFLQAGFWKTNAPEFDRALDKLLIAIRKENLVNIGEKHHVMQAAKYLLSEGASDEDREKIYSSILPYSTNSMEYNQKLFKKELKKRKIKNLETSDGLTIKIDKDSDLERAVKEATSLGFKYLTVLTTKKNYDETQKKYNLVRILREDTEGLESLVGDRAERARKRRDFISKVLSPLKFITYPIIGMAPSYLQDKLEEYVGSDSYDAEEASIASTLTLLLGSLGFMVGFGIIEGLNYGWQFPQRVAEALNVYHFASAGIVFVEELLKICCAESYGWGGSFGNLFGRIALFPVEGVWRLVDYAQRPSEEQRSLVMEIALECEDQKSTKAKNYFSRLEGLSKKSVTKKAKDSLVWGNQNHFAFGKRLSSELLKDYKGDRQQFFDRQNNALNIYTSYKIGDYCKVDGLACFSEERYVFSLITKKEPDMGELNAVLAGKEDVNKKLKTLGEINDSEFIRLMKYEGVTKKDDYEAIKW